MTIDSTDPRADHLRLLKARLPEDADIPSLIAELEVHYRGRGVNIVEAAGGWTVRTAPDLGPRLKLVQKISRKLSRAEIEDIRGVVVSSGTLDLLMEIGWIGPKGRRQTVGRPVTWGTTDAFLLHFGLAT